MTPTPDNFKASYEAKESQKHTWRAILNNLRFNDYVMKFSLSIFR